jgi:hypothetical protein
MPFDLSAEEHANQIKIFTYPFEASEDKFWELSYTYKELGGYRFGVPETLIEYSSVIDVDQDPLIPTPSYGSSRKSFIDFKDGDLKRLEPGMWLNDNNVTFFISWQVQFFYVW